MYLVLILLCLVALAFGWVQEAPDGSVCFNNCNGHGDCIDYSCHCHPGYHGDDCGTTFADESHIVPILTAGHFNVTRKNFTQTVTKNKLLLVGFSSYNCHRCIQAEVEYEKIAEKLKELKIPFARADADKTKSFAAEFGATELPALVLFNKQRPVLYKGVHSAEAVVTYIRKQIEKPAKVLKTVEDVNAFVASRKEAKYSVSTVMVVGFFSEHEDVEEDDYTDFMENAKELQSNEDVYFGVVTNPATCEWFKKNKTIDRTPSMMVVGESEQVHTINLDELFGDKLGIKEWVLRKSIPLVGKMTNQNFQLYNKIGLPMLMLFLDLTNELATTTPRTVGGKSGGIFNEVLLDEFKLAAREHVDRILFVYLDGTLYQDQMKSLGLFGGKERLPSLAFNTRDGSQIAFPEELAINKDTLLQFCAEFISGKLRNAADVKEMAKKALQTVLPINTKNKVERQKIKEAPEVVRGVSEQFGDGNAGDDAVVAVTTDNFNDIVLNEDKDVVLLLHSRNCEPCSHFAVYYKRMAERFRDLDIPTLVIAQMDVGTYTPPAHLNLIVGALPIVAMVPSNNKHPPWTFYSGIGKVYSMMKWVHQQSSMPFDLPNLAHLTPKDREAYKTQVREREEALDAKRREDERAMAAMDRERAELARRKRKEEKKRLQQGGEQEGAAEAGASVSGGEGVAAEREGAKLASIEVMPAGDIDSLDDSDEF